MYKETHREQIRVESYSGYKANERPTSFFLEGRRVGVLDVIDRWYGTEHDFFKVLGDDGRIYLLKWQRLVDKWFMVHRVERVGKH